MFSSISKTTPQTQASTSFTATRSMVIAPTTNFVITVNGTAPLNPNSISVSYGDIVTATVTTPDDFTWHEFYYYTIDDVPQSFAVVNKSLYTIHVREEDAIKRWYLYFPTEHTLTYQSPGGANTPIILGNNFDSVPPQVHVILDPLTESVFLYTQTGVELSKVQLPAAPIDYVKIPSKDSIVVLTHGGETYEIFLNSTSRGLAPFFARRDYSEFTGEIGYINRLPGEDLITYLRRLRNRKTIPAATCLCYNGTYIYAGGNGSVWVVDPRIGFALISNFSIEEYVLNIAPLPDNLGALVVTQNQKVYSMDIDGAFTLIHQGTALCQPVLFNGKIYIPEGEFGKLLVFDPVTSTIESEIILPEFSPSYTSVVDGKMYVCGRDTERVLIFDADMNITERTFPDKVTWLSVLNNTFVASHWMKSFTTLYSDDLYRVVGLGFPKRYGPVSHIGTNVSEIKTLGNGEVYGYTPIDAWLWLNGQRTYSNGTRGTLLVAGDIVSLNYSARIAGPARTNCVIGDTAYDYDVEAFEETYYPRNIDLGIEGPALNNVHTRTIRFPTFFTPCRMSIEYGAIKVNDAYYYGDTVVTAGDIVVIEISTKGNSALPVFTVGARQFVIPVSTKPGLGAPITIETADLRPGSTVVNEIIFGPELSLYDYIIPGYYDITVKKNDVDITGNYYQQFGSGDKLVVEFNSSSKKYDVKDVYILGPTSYHFVAKNIIDNPIGYLDYGILEYPYTRRFDPYSSGDDIIAVGSGYGNAVICNTPEVQYFTANLTIRGLMANVPGNISLVGGDSFVVLNGNVITSTEYVQVSLDDQLALARNIVSYFDEPVTVIQHLPTGDEDGFMDITVGVWNVLNRTIASPDASEKQFEFYIDPYTGTVDKTNVSTQADITLDLLRPAQRLKPMYRESLGIDNIANSVSPTLVIEKPADVTDAAPSAITGTSSIVDAEQYRLSHNNVSGVEAVAATNVLDNSSSLDAESPTVVRLGASVRRVNIKDMELSRETTISDLAALALADKDTVMVDSLYRGSMYKSTIMVETALSPAFAPDTVMTPGSFKITFDAINELVVAGGTVGWNTQPSDGVSSYSMERSKAQVRAIPSNKHGLLRELVFVVDGSKSELTGEFVDPQIAAVPRLITGTEIVPTPTLNPFFNRMTSFTGQVKSLFNASVAKFSDQIRAVNEIQNILLPEQITVINSRVSNFIGAPQGIEFIGMPSTATELLPFKLLLSSEIIEQDIIWQGYITSGEDVPGQIPVLDHVIEFAGSKVVAQKSSINVTESRRRLSEIESVDYGIWDRSVPFKFRSNEVNGDEIAPLLITHTDAFNKSGFLVTSSRSTFANTTTLKTSSEYTYSKNTPLKTSSEYTYSENSILKLTRAYTFDEIVPLKLIKAYAFDKIAPLNIKDAYTTSRTLVTLADGYNELFDSTPFIAATRGIENLVTMEYAQNIVQTEKVHMEFAPAERNFASAISLPAQNIVDYSQVTMGFVVADRNTIFVDQEFASEAIPISAEVPMQYIVDERRYTTGFMQYNRNEPLSIVKSDLTWAAGDHSLPGISAYSLELENNIPSALVKLNWLRNTPEYYTQSTIPDPEFDNGYVWEHEIATEYGAFATEADAIYAARTYTEFRPFLIMDTNLWSYRVILDTGLVCNLPKGRYPVAWLIRGG